MRSKIKRIVSLLCVLTMLVSGVPFGNYLQKVEAENASEMSFYEDFNDLKYSDCTAITVGGNGVSWGTRDAATENYNVKMKDGGSISGGTELGTTEHRFDFFMEPKNGAKLSIQMGGKSELDLNFIEGYDSATSQYNISLFFNGEKLGVLAENNNDAFVWYTVKILRMGENLAVKVWKSSEEEPARYTYMVTDPLFADTYGLTVASSGYTTRFDNFSGSAQVEPETKVVFSEDFNDLKYSDCEAITVGGNGVSWSTRDAATENYNVKLNDGGYISGGTEPGTIEHRFDFFMEPKNGAKLSVQMGGKSELDLNFTEGYDSATGQYNISLFFNGEELGMLAENNTEAFVWYTVKLLRMGDNLAVKVWKSSEEEPAGYTYMVSDGLFADTYGLTVASSGYTTRFDNFSGSAQAEPEPQPETKLAFSEDFNVLGSIDAAITVNNYEWGTRGTDDYNIVLKDGGSISVGEELNTHEHSFDFFMNPKNGAKLSILMGGKSELDLNFAEGYAGGQYNISLSFNDEQLGMIAENNDDAFVWYTVKLLRTGENLSVKVWKSSEAESTAATYTIEDPLFADTYGLTVVSSGEKTRFDNFSGWAIDTNPENQGEQPNPEFRKRGFSSFGIEDGEYTKESMSGTSKATQGSINWDGTVIYGDFRMSAGGGTYFNLGGKNSPWYGLIFNTASDGKMSLKLIDTDENRNELLAVFDPNVAGQLLGDWVRMMISSEFVDADGDGVENDVKLGIWFNEVLYNQTYITIKDYAENLGGMALIGLNNEAAKVEINSYPEYKGDDKIIIDNTEQPNPAFRKRGFSSFGIKDGDYSYESMSGKSKSSKGGINWDGTVIYGDIKMPATGGTYINLGGKTSPWFGLVLTTGTGGSLILRLIDTDENRNESLAAFYPYQAGTTLLGEWVQLMMSSEFVDADGDGVKNDVKLGIWFNEVLYNGTYITIKDYAHRLGGRALIGLSDEAATISIRSYPEYKGNDKMITEQPNASFTKKTFASFGIKDGEYTYENTSGKMAVNKARFSLDKTVIRGDFLIAEGSRTYLYFGGKSNPWYGIVFIPASDGRMSLTLIDGERKQWLSTLDPEIAGTKLFGEWVDFMMSTEFIDADGDGNINDVKLGIWFNEVLYDDKYITIKDYADKMGGMLNFYCEKPGSSISLRSNMNYYTKERFDYESFGLTDKWRSTLFGSQNAYTGDTTNIVCWSIVAGVALVGLLLYGVTQKKKKGRMNL